MFDVVDWSRCETHMREGHGLSVVHAEEALSDPEQVVFDPDYNSQSGESIRVIGYSESAEMVLTVILVKSEGRIFGANGWEANGRDRRIYEGETG